MDLKNLRSRASIKGTKNPRVLILVFSLLCLVSFISSEIGNAVPPAVGTAGDRCAVAFEPAANLAASSEQQIKEAAAIQAGKLFFNYFDVMRWNLKERDYLLDLIEQALIAQEGVLIMGPPGTAKSQVADTVLGGIIDEDKENEKRKEIAKAKKSAIESKTEKKNKKGGNLKTLVELDAEPVNSFFRLQLTPETTMSETHGPLNFKKLTEENIYDRKYEDSMLNFKNVFIDEIFDARPNALRNILGILGERAHSQGGRTRKAKLETFIAATNSYLSQVYEKAGNDGPKAVIDRFSFSSFVPGELEKTKSAVDIIRGAKKPSNLKEIPRLTFQELDQIRDLVPDVDIPIHVASFLAVLSKQLNEETEAMQTASLKQYEDSLRNGEPASPPYRATKYHSPRSLGKAAGILKAWVVRDWLKQQLNPAILPENKRQLKATLEDVKALEQFFTLNGPSDAYVKKLIARASDHEKAQLETIVKEREIFQSHFTGLFKPIHDRFHSQLGKYDYEVHGASTASAKKEVAHQLALQWVSEVVPHLPKTDELSELDGNAIGALMLDEVLSQSGIGLVGDEEWERLTKSLIEKRPGVAEAPVAIPTVTADDTGILKDYKFITLPAVTQKDVQALQKSKIETYIIAQIPSFKAADAVTSIGLYLAVMGEYPGLDFLKDKIKEEKMIESWKANPDLPLTYTTRAQDQQFVDRLNELTGRRFRIPTDPELEYMIRGRIDGVKGGPITTTQYHFGESADDLRNHGYIAANSGNQMHGVHEIKQGDFRNNLGLIHAIGNVWQRSSDGTIRGGDFNDSPERVKSSYSRSGCADLREPVISLRLVEDI